jgi:hypothetical protein
MTIFIRRFKRTATLAVLLFGVVAAPLSAMQASLETGSVMEAVERLKPGEYLWAPDIAPAGPVLIIVSLTNQRAITYRNGVQIGVSTVSTGKAGYETPTGLFTILQKHVDHKSNLYDDAPMPYMQRLTWTGVTRLGLTVVITDESAVPRIAPIPDPLQPTASDADAPPPAGGFTWRPERAPTGPVSIVISTADRRMIVLRNGREIGATPVEINAVVDRTAAYTLRAVDDTGFHWLRLPLPGGSTPTPTEVTPGERSRLRIAEEFRRLVAAVLTPGATVLVTTDTLARGGTGRKLTVIAGEPE